MKLDSEPAFKEGQRVLSTDEPIQKGEIVAVDGVGIVVHWEGIYITVPYYYSSNPNVFVWVQT